MIVNESLKDNYSYDNLPTLKLTITVQLLIVTSLVLLYLLTLVIFGSDESPFLSIYSYMNITPLYKQHVIPLIKQHVPIDYIMITDT